MLLMYGFGILTHISLGSFIWDISKQCRTRSDATFCGEASDQVLHCLLTENTFKNSMELKLTTQQPLNSKWIHPIDKCGKFH